ncbi:MAG: D-alanyl-D-alanine carboxypeptidase family protein [Lachnospirales bacterium]
MKKILALFFVFIFVFQGNIVFAEDKENNLKLYARSACLIDGNTGRVLYGLNENEPMAMASTTKIMTAIIALENSNINSKVTVGKNPPLTPKVKMNLVQGEELTLEQLLYALLMQSSNDAAVAIAEYVGGSVEGFCNMMNEKAKKIGCTDTFFETPNGLDKGNHHSTAYDMAKIGAYALRNKEFVRISNTKSVHFKSNKKVYDITNKNQFLNSYNGAIGIKTGFTGKAGHCFAGAVKRGDITLVSVVLACGWGQSGKAKKWADTKTLMDYGFENYDLYSLEDSFHKVDVEKSKDKKVTLLPDGFCEVLLKKDKSEQITVKANVETPLTAPIKRGDRLGDSIFYVNGYEVGRVGLIASNNIEENSFKNNFEKIYKGWLDLIC